jgi:predicted deacylase
MTTTCLQLHEQMIIISAVNILGLNTFDRHWSFDNTDINRMFPGYDKDERATARLFGLPAVIERPTSAIFTTTIGHAWEAHGGANFVLRARQRWKSLKWMCTISGWSR